MHLELDSQKLPSYTLSELLRLIGTRAQQMTDAKTKGRVLQLLASAIGSGLVETFELRAVSAEGPRPAGQKLQSPETESSDEAAAATGDDELEIYDRSELNMYHDGLLFSRRALPALLACLQSPLSSSDECGSVKEWATELDAALQTEVARFGERIRRCAELSRAESRSFRVEPSNELKCVQLQVRCSLLLLDALLRAAAALYRRRGNGADEMVKCYGHLSALISQLPPPDSLSRYNSFHSHIIHFRDLKFDTSDK